MFIIICILSAIIASMGIGGGSIFILLMTIFGILDYKVAMGYNLVMFICTGITSTFVNLKNKNFDKKIFFKIIICTIPFAIIGAMVSNSMNVDDIKIYFNFFILIIGIYEIFSSLNSFKKQKI